MPGVRFVSGAKVATLTEECAGLITAKVRVCVIHVGTNDIKTQGQNTPEILADYENFVSDQA